MSDQTNDTQRAFIHFGRSWYARHNNHRDGMIDLVTFGNWHRDGSGDSEINVVWHEQGPRLECFSDSWFGLAGMKDLISTLGNLGGYTPTPLEFCELLSAHGFEDRTPLTRDGRMASQRQEATEVVDILGKVEDFLARDLSAADAPNDAAAPLVNIGDPLYFYARPGDILDQGWYICTVTGRPSCTSALVVFQLADGATNEREAETRMLYPEPPITAPVLNQAEHDAAHVRYYHTGDYGWLRVTIDSLITDHGLALISASNRGEVLIADELVYAADLHAALPAGAIAWNEPTLGEWQNGDSERLICPNCEGGQYDNQTDTDNPLRLHACIHCHFNFIKPVRVDAPELLLSATD